LRQRHQEPDLEHQKSQKWNDYTDRDGHEPMVVPQPFHERNDQQRRGRIYSEIRNRCDIDRSRDNHRQHLTDLSPLREHHTVVDTKEDFRKIDGAENQNGNTDVERKEPRLRALRTPANADLDASVYSDQSKDGHGNSHANLDSPVGRTRPTGF